MLASFASCLLVLAGAAPADRAAEVRRPVPVPVVYVDPAGDDVTGDGSAANPFRTLQRGHDVVDQGGTVRARAGAYPFAVAVSKSVVLERDGGGTVTLGPPATGTVTVTVTAADVTLRALSFAGGAGLLGVLGAGDRLAVEGCAFTGTGRGAIQLAPGPSSGHGIRGCVFQDVRGPLPAVALDARNASALVCADCRFTGGDVAVRLESCASARVEACRFLDHFQSALVAVASSDLVVDGCRFTRCGHFPTPLQAVAPAEALATLSLVAGSDRARVSDTIVEDCGGHLGKNAFRAGASTLFDGLFGLAVLGCADVAVTDCCLHRNRFGGVWVGGATTALVLTRCNFVANGSDNDPGKDVAVYADGGSVSATSCFFGAAGGPVFDGAGFGNGVLGPVTVTSAVAAPYDAPAFGLAADRSAPAADRSVALAAADLTGDGWNEVVAVGDRTGTVEAHVNGANGFTAREVTPIAGSEPVGLVPGSFDGDAHRDVAVLDALGARVVFLFGDGTGRFMTQRSVAVHRRPVAVVAGALDGQAGDDVAVACQGDAFAPGAVEVLRNDGSGTFTAVALAGAVRPCAVALLDVDGDADLDVVGFDLDPIGPGLRVWRNDGSGGFGAVAATPVDTHPVTDASLAVLDQDGGAPDLAVASFQLLPLPGVCRVRLFRGDGMGGFLPPLELRARTGPLVLHAARVGDGARPFLLAVDRGAHQVLALGPIAADAAASFPYAQTFGDVPLAVAAARFTNRFSADDLVVAQAATGRLVVQRGRQEAPVVRYGTGCPGTGGTPRVQWASLPEIGSATFAFGFDGALAGAPAVFALGTGRLDIPVGSCRVLVNPLITLGAAADAGGAGAIPFAIPASLSILDAPLNGQWFVVDPGGGLLGALAATEGIEIVIGG